MCMINETKPSRRYRIGYVVMRKSRYSKKYRSMFYDPKTAEPCYRPGVWSRARDWPNFGRSGQSKDAAGFHVLPYKSDAVAFRFHITGNIRERAQYVVVRAAVRQVRGQGQASLSFVTSTVSFLAIRVLERKLLNEIKVAP